MPLHVSASSYPPEPHVTASTVDTSLVYQNRTSIIGTIVLWLYSQRLATSNNYAPSPLVIVRFHSIPSVAPSTRTIASRHARMYPRPLGSEREPRIDRGGHGSGVCQASTSVQSRNCSARHRRSDTHTTARAGPAGSASGQGQCKRSGLAPSSPTTPPCALARSRVQSSRSSVRVG